VEFADVVERPFRHHGEKTRIGWKHIVAERRQGTLHAFELLKCLSKFGIIFDQFARGPRGSFCRNAAAHGLQLIGGQLDL
jgi:hypothetical protein